MFNGVPHEQFHQFIASSRTTTALPLSLPLNVSPPTFSSFIDVNPHHQLSHQQVFQSHLLHQLHRQSSNNTHHIIHDQHHHRDEEKEDQERVVDEHCGNLELADHQGVRSVSEMVDPWEKDEVVELLRIRSSLGINNNGFSDFIWGHVSRKLAELGFKRSAEKCKEKFEEMNQLCCNNDITNYRSSFSELEALFEDQNPKTSSTDEKNMVIRTDGHGGDQRMGLNLEENSGNETLENPYVENQCMVKKQLHRRKRKRHHKLELLKGLCEEIVNRIMVQQEELHKKLLQDMERKEDERVAREEAWKKKEMDRINKEIEIRAQEQAIACDRETTIIEFLKKFTSSSTSSNPLSQTQDLELKTDHQDIIKLITPQNPNLPSSSPSIFLSENPNSPSRVPPQNSPKLPTSSTVATATKKPVSCTTTHQNNPKIPNSSHLDLACQNPSSLITQNNPDVTSSSSTTPLITVPQNPSSSSNDRDQENGKRWPRDEVYSLINLRCNLCSSGDQDKESTKVPLWERISQGMLELGYKRSAKKCKEKWENINKYFRKTKDTNKKRSLDSKTCPYFHQLNSLYNQGRLVLPSEGPENHSGSTENHPESPETIRVSGGTFSTDHQAMVHANEGAKNNIIQVSPLEFDY